MVSSGVMVLGRPTLGGRRRRRAVGSVPTAYGRAAPTKPSDQTGSKVTTVPVWAAWMMVLLP